MTDTELQTMRIACLAEAIMSGCHSHDDLRLLVTMLGMAAKSTAEIEAVVDGVIAQNPDKVKLYQAGKTQLLGFFVGQVMKMTGGTANPVEVNRMLATRLLA